jgi:hypothetical protein
MATRHYFPSSSTPPLATLARDTNWELPTASTNPSVARHLSLTTKANTALTTTTLTWPATATQQWCWWQFQTDTLASGYSFTTSDTISMVVGKCAETTTSGDSHLAFSLRVVSGDGATVRGTLLLFHATSTEYPLVASAATRIHSARAFTSAIAAQAGDRLILEVGLHGLTPAAENVQMRIGDPSATADFALTAALTTDLCSWWEVSPTLTYGTPAVSGNPTMIVVPDWQGIAIVSGG